MKVCDVLLIIHQSEDDYNSDSNGDDYNSDSNEDDYNRYNIMHNAGVTGNDAGRFYKAEYMNELPYNKVLEIDRKTASWYYWREVRKTAKKSVLI
jgi:hypothetical protein